MSHMLVVLFAACGISGMVAYFEDIDATAGYPAFLKGLAEVSWPLAVAAGLYMLVQVACQLQQAVLTLQLRGLPPSAQESYDDTEERYGEEESHPCPHRYSSPQREAPRNVTVEEKRRPVSFFDISDAVIPPPPQQTPVVASAVASEQSGGQDGAGRAGAAAMPAEQPAPSAQPAAGKVKPEKDPHFFTLD